MTYLDTIRARYMRGPVPKPRGSCAALCLECGDVKTCNEFNRTPFENFAPSFCAALAWSGVSQLATGGIAICDACMCASRVQAEDRALSFAMGAHGRLGAISAVQCLAGEPGLLSLIAKPVNKSRDPVDECVKCPSPFFPEGYIAWRLLESSLRGKLPAVIPTMCRFWEKDGHCKNGDRCKFAHHPLEIEAMRFRVCSAGERSRFAIGDQRAGIAAVNHAVIAWIHDEKRERYLDDDNDRQAARGRDTTQERQHGVQRPLDAIEEAKLRPAGNTAVPPGASRQTCVFWQNVGSCKWGRACKFEHAGADRRNSEGWAPRIGPSTTPWQEWCEDYSKNMFDRFLRLIAVDPGEFRLFEEAERERESRRVRDAEEWNRRVREDEAKRQWEWNSRVRDNQAKRTPDALCQGVCSHCQIQKQFGARGTDVCSYNGSNWSSCCKCARDRHGWVGYDQNACRNCLARLDGAEVPWVRLDQGAPRGGFPFSAPSSSSLPAFGDGVAKAEPFLFQGLGAGPVSLASKSPPPCMPRKNPFEKASPAQADDAEDGEGVDGAGADGEGGVQPAMHNVDNVARPQQCRPPGFGLITASGPVPWVWRDRGILSDSGHGTHGTHAAGAGNKSTVHHRERVHRAPPHGVTAAPRGGFPFIAPSSSSLPAFGDGVAKAEPFLFRGLGAGPVAMGLRKPSPSYFEGSALVPSRNRRGNVSITVRYWLSDSDGRARPHGVTAARRGGFPFSAPSSSSLPAFGDGVAKAEPFLFQGLGAGPVSLASKSPPPCMPRKNPFEKASPAQADDAEDGEGVDGAGADGEGGVQPAMQLDTAEAQGSWAKTSELGEHATLAAGSRVELHGLQRAVHLNGRAAHVLSLDAHTGRLAVELTIAGPGEAHSHKVKPENLRTLSPLPCTARAVSELLRAVEPGGRVSIPSGTYTGGDTPSPAHGAPGQLQLEIPTAVTLEGNGAEFQFAVTVARGARGALLRLSNFSVAGHQMLVRGADVKRVELERLQISYAPHLEEDALVLDQIGRGPDKFGMPSILIDRCSVRGGSDGVMINEWGVHLRRCNISGAASRGIFANRHFVIEDSVVTGCGGYGMKTRSGCERRGGNDIQPGPWDPYPEGSRPGATFAGMFGGMGYGGGRGGAEISDEDAESDGDSVSDDDEYGLWGFTRAEEEELLCQGVMPWDDDAHAVLAALNGDFY